MSILHQNHCNHSPYWKWCRGHDGCLQTYLPLQSRPCCAAHRRLWEDCADSSHHPRHQIGFSLTHFLPFPLILIPGSVSTDRTGFLQSYYSSLLPLSILSHRTLCGLLCTAVWLLARLGASLPWRVDSCEGRVADFKRKSKQVHPAVL